MLDESTSTVTGRHRRRKITKATTWILRVVALFMIAIVVLIVAWDRA